MLLNKFKTYTGSRNFIISHFYRRLSVFNILHELGIYLLSALFELSPLYLNLTLFSPLFYLIITSVSIEFIFTWTYPCKIIHYLISISFITALAKQSSVLLKVLLFHGFKFSPELGYNTVDRWQTRYNPFYINKVMLSKWEIILDAFF